MEGGDCDDEDAALNPGADELCNGIDDNCDGDTDELGAVDGTTNALTRFLANMFGG